LAILAQLRSTLLDWVLAFKGAGAAKLVGVGVGLGVGVGVGAGVGVVPGLVGAV
jgi:hypothetical protein